MDHRKTNVNVNKKETIRDQRVGKVSLNGLGFLFSNIV